MAKATKVACLEALATFNFDEIAVTQKGAFHYALKNIKGIPVWFTASDAFVFDYNVDADESAQTGVYPTKKDLLKQGEMKSLLKNKSFDLASPENSANCMILANVEPDALEGNTVNTYEVHCNYLNLDAADMNIVYNTLEKLVATFCASSIVTC